MSASGKKRGVVRRIGQSQYGYFVLFEGDDRYFNTKYEPRFNEGDEVGVEFGNGNAKRAQIRKVVKVFSTGNAPAPSQSGNSGGSSGGHNDRQDSIVWQHSQEIAVRVVACLQNLSKGKPTSEEALLAKVDELTFRYFQDAIDPRNSAAFSAEEQVEADLSEAEDTADKPEEVPGDDDDWGDDWE